CPGQRRQLHRIMADRTRTASDKQDLSLHRSGDENSAVRGHRRTAAAALILMQANPEWPASAALDAVAAIRPRAWPNLLILEFGDALLGRNGEIVAAAGAIYRRVLARDPEFGDQMIDAGRDREVSAAYRETG